MPPFTKNSCALDGLEDFNLNETPNNLSLALVETSCGWRGPQPKGKEIMRILDVAGVRWCPLETKRQKPTMANDKECC